jgi:hypothetical protein
LNALSINQSKGGDTVIRVTFKGCARCGGDVIQESYSGEDSEAYCLQCSYRPAPPAKPEGESNTEDRYAKFEALRELARSSMKKASTGG